MVGRRSGSSMLLACVVAALVAGSAQGASYQPAPGGRTPPSPEVSSVWPATAMTKTCGPRQAWIGSNTDGVACLDTAGWKLFDESKPFPGSGFIHDIAVCRNGMAWIAGSSGLLSTNGRTWTNHAKATKNHSFEAVACDSKGRVWLAGYGILAFYNGSKMTTYPVSKLGTGKYVKSLEDITVAPDGHVWVTTANSVATFNGSTWTYFENGHGFDKEYYVDRVAVDSQGRVWLATSSGILSYDGQTWTADPDTAYWQVQALAVDGKDRLWVGTYSRGVAMFDGQSWVTYDRSNSSLPSNKIKALATDSRGRVWIGTEWGLAILADTTWQVYHVHDSDIPANEVSSLGVVGNGPMLPALMTKKPGGLTGRLLRSGVGQAGLSVEICVEYVGMMYSGSTPCSNQPFHQATTTGADGRFRFSGLNAGDYVITFQDTNGKWLVLSTQWGLGSSSQEVRPGKTTNVGDLDLAKVK